MKQLLEVNINLRLGPQLSPFTRCYA